MQYFGQTKNRRIKGKGEDCLSVKQIAFVGISDILPQKVKLLSTQNKYGL